MNGQLPTLGPGDAGLLDSADRRRVVLPATASVTLIVNTVDWPHRPPAFVHGPHSRPVPLAGPCSPAYLQVTLSPPAAARVLGVPLGELGDGLVDLGDLFGAAGTCLHEQVRAEPVRRRRVLERELRRRLADGRPLAAPVDHAWRRLVATGGAASIGGLAGEVGWSHQHLITRFRHEIGATPKAAAQLVRLRRLWRALDRDTIGPGADDAPRWAELAARTGYTDQSHLIRDVRRFTGTTPTDYLARRRPGCHGGPLRGDDTA